jgi:predicted glycosyltransferase
MNFLFDIGHPAHVHLFKNTISQLKIDGHKVIITIKDDRTIKDLLDYSNLNYIVLGKKGKGVIRKSIKQVGFSFKVFGLLRKYKIDIAVGVSISIAQACLFLKSKAIVFDDDDISATPVFAALSHRFASRVVSPNILKKERNRKKDVFYAGYHELAYLHPNRFKPNQDILKEIGITKGDFFSIVRFSALQAHHDIFEHGISNKQAIIIVELLEQKGKVFITSEKPLPVALRKYQLALSPNKFHDVLSFASILVCDSQTVASEAAILGVPSVRINTFVGRISYLKELEHQYQLTFGFKPHQFEQAYTKIQKIINVKDAKKVFLKRRQKILSDKIDLTAFMLWLIENYPKSIDIIKANPNYQYKFK